MNRKILSIMVVAIVLVSMSIEGVRANGEVKFRGVVATNEEWGEFVCYSSYYCNVTVEEILCDPNCTLSIGKTVTVCYNQSLSLKVGDSVECYGFYYEDVGPLQCVGRIYCINDCYYVIPEFPSLLILLLFMMATLSVVAYGKKHSFK